MTNKQADLIDEIEQEKLYNYPVDEVQELYSFSDTHTCGDGCTIVPQKRYT